MMQTYQEAYKGIPMEHRLIGLLCNAFSESWREGGCKPSGLPGWTFTLERDEEALVLARLKERHIKHQKMIDSLGKNMESLERVWTERDLQEVKLIEYIERNIAERLRLCAEVPECSPDQRNDIRAHGVNY